MPLDPQILARSSDEPFIKVIVGAVVAVFWLISAIASAIKRSTEESKRRQALSQNPQQAAAAAQLQRVAQPKRVVAPPKIKPPIRQAPPRESYAAPTARAIEAMPATNLSRATAATQVTHKQPTTTVAPPSQIAKLLCRPDTLRAAFILNEVLTPPLSLRDGPGGRGHI